MIYLKMTRLDRNFVKKTGSRAFYDPKTDKIVLLKMREDEVAGVVSHEMMHKLFCDACQFKASDSWDKNLAVRLESWLGWRPGFIGYAARMVWKEIIN